MRRRLAFKRHDPDLPVDKDFSLEHPFFYGIDETVIAADCMPDQPGDWGVASVYPGNDVRCLSHRVHLIMGRHIFYFDFYVAEPGEYKDLP